MGALLWLWHLVSLELCQVFEQGAKEGKENCCPKPLQEEEPALFSQKSGTKHSSWEWEMQVSLQENLNGL